MKKLAGCLPISLGACAVILAFAAIMQDPHGSAGAINNIWDQIGTVGHKIAVFFSSLDV